MTEIEETAYAFYLDEIREGCAYYRTHSQWSEKRGDHGRDYRHPEPVSVASFLRFMDQLGQPIMWVRSDDQLTRWAHRFGWILTPVAYAEQHLSSLLGSRECVKSAIGLYRDVSVSCGGITRRRIPRNVCQRVLDRDRHRCIECEQVESDSVKLTMHHVLPYSRGGETSEGNLVTLCEQCNQGHGNSLHPHLFLLAGLDYGWDPNLLKNAISARARDYAIALTDNIMVSHCTLTDVPLLGRAETVGAKLRAGTRR